MKNVCPIAHHIFGVHDEPMSDWRSKADEDLTQDDLSNMWESAVPVENAQLPAGAQILTQPQIYLTASNFRPQTSMLKVLASGGVLVTNEAALA